KTKRWTSLRSETRSRSSTARSKRSASTLPVHFAVCTSRRGSFQNSEICGIKIFHMPFSCFKVISRLTGRYSGARHGGTEYGAHHLSVIEELTQNKFLKT